MRLWSVEDGNVRATLQGHERGVMSVAFSPDGRTIASGSLDGTVFLWSVEDGSVRVTLQRHEGGVRSVAFSPDGRTLASGSQDGTVLLWSVEDGSVRATLRGHDRRVMSVAFSPDGRTIASGSGDGTVRLLSVEDGSVRVTLQGHERGGQSVAFSPDGRTLASGSGDGTVRLWKSSEYASIANFRDGVLTRTPAGCRIDIRHQDLVVGWKNPRFPGSTFYLPAEPLRELLHQPERVARYLQGDTTVGTFADFVTSLGYTDAPTWDGTRTILPTRSTPTPAPPFTPGPTVAPEHLVGRERDLEALVAAIDTSASVVLLGPRRAGKSSLLSALAERLRAHRTVISISLETARALGSRDDLAKLLAPELASSPTPADALLDRSWPRPPVFVIDEMAHLQRLPPAELSWLRALSQRGGPVVLAGSRQDWTLITRHAAREAGASFGNDLSPYELGPLPLEDATAWLRAPRPDAAPLPDTMVRRVIAQCGTWPFYLQVMGQALVSAVRRGDHAPLQTEAAFLDLYERALLLDRTPMFEGRWNELTLPVRTLLHEHAEAPRPRYDTLDEELQIALNECGLCDVRGRWLEDGPFFEWVRVQRRALGFKLKAQRAAN
ncbi:MAG: AAA family ATPase [Polyangiales bacterium]